MTNMTYFIICGALGIAGLALAVITNDLRAAYGIGLFVALVMFALNHYLKKP